MSGTNAMRTEDKESGMYKVGMAVFMNYVMHLVSSSLTVAFSSRKFRSRSLRR